MHLVSYALFAHRLVLLSRRREGPFLVAIDGRGGSGKTTFAGELALHSSDVLVVHGDEFSNLGVTGGLDVSRLVDQLVEPLKRGAEASFNVFDPHAQEFKGWRSVDPRGVIVIEGVSLLRSSLRRYWDLSVWIEVSREVSHRRGLERDGLAAQTYWELWLAEEDEYIFRDRPSLYADIVVCGSPTQDFDVESSFAVEVDRSSWGLCQPPAPDASAGHSLTQRARRDEEGS